MLARMMDRIGADMIERWCKGKGVKRQNRRESNWRKPITDKNSKSSLLTVRPIMADHIVCAAGVKPNIDFLEDSGIEVDAGVLVDHSLQTNVPNILCCG